MLKTYTKSSAAYSKNAPDPGISSSPTDNITAASLEEDYKRQGDKLL